MLPWGFNEGDGDVYHFISHLELQRTHLRTEADKGGLEDFRAKMDAKKTTVMEDCSVAESKPRSSTPNTLAYLCLPGPLLDKEIKPMLTEGFPKTCHSGKSVLLSKAKSERGARPFPSEVSKMTDVQILAHYKPAMMSHYLTSAKDPRLAGIRSTPR